MKLLDNRKKIQNLDKENMLATIQDLAKQAEQVVRDLGRKKLLPNPKTVKNIIVGGMGGSALGAHVIQALFSDQLKVPFCFVNDYKLPNHVNKDSLVIISSYSGNTEEAISLLKEAKKRKAKVAIVAAGGKLAKLAQKNRVPAYIFEAKHNYCGQPRLALGYALFSLLILLRNSGYLKMGDQEIKKGVKLLNGMNKKFGVQKKIENNEAKQWAEQLRGQAAVLMGAEFLAGNVHIMANQLNETSKNFSSYFLIPELNHHLLEGLSHPAWFKHKALCLLFVSDLYHTRNQKRFLVTQKILKKAGHKFLVYKPQGKTKFEQSLEMMSFGSYLSFYLGILHKIDPSPVPIVEFLKKQMA